MFQVQVNLFDVRKCQELNYITKTAPWGCKGATKRRANSSNCKTRNIMYTGQVARRATLLFCGHHKWNEKVVHTRRKLCLTYSWYKKTVDDIRDKQNKSPVETVEILKIPVQGMFQVQVNLFVIEKYQELNFITKMTPWGCKGANKNLQIPKLERYYNIHRTSVKKCNTNVLRTPEVEWKGGSHLTNSVSTPGALPRQKFKTTNNNR